MKPLPSFASFTDLCHRVRPASFLVLGSGLGTLIDRMEVLATLPFSAIPGLAASSVQGHRGRWALVHWAGQPLVISEGRLHYYEGHPWHVVEKPLRVAAELGVRRAVLTNAAGGIRDDLLPGSLLPLRDHVQWNHPFPWRDPPQPSPYSPYLLRLIAELGQDLPGVRPPGIYAAVTGPSYETPAEIRALRSVGADAVGMSTSREILAGVQAGLECAAISLITNRASGLSSGPLNHAEVLVSAQQAASQLAVLLERLLQAIRD